ncbi:putative nuclease HARBI1 [Ornithodoros turicata]|uniref:putative nuclease HARBI1 n=1 Tax=Ornithodoros turicata TaxID=34597 RepID=UPI00313A0B69
MDNHERCLYLSTFGAIAAGLLLMRIRRRRQERRIRILQQRNRRLMAMLAAVRSPSPEPRPAGANHQGARRPRRVWTRIRSENFWNHVMSPEFTAQDWLHNFHVSRETFTDLCEQLRDYIQTQDTAWRLATPVEKKVAVFLWRLATNCHYKVLSQLFGVGRSSACIILKESTQAIVQHLLPQYLNPKDDSTQTSHFFEEVYGLPVGCCGVLGAMYITVSPPSYVKAEYGVTQEGGATHYVCLLQVVVGKDGKIVAARAGQTPSRPGRLEDWAYSNIIKDETSYLAAGPPFELRPEVMVQFVDPSTKAQRTFNSAIAGVLGYLSQTLSRLRGRFKCVAAKYEGDLSSIGDLATACCVMHNICEGRSDRFDPNWAEGPPTVVPTTHPIPGPEEEARERAKEKRSALAESLVMHEIA